MCQADMLISFRCVKELGKAGEISQSGTQSTVLTDANGNRIEVHGFITLYWKFLGGQRTRNDRFLVVRPDQFDVVIGVKAIARMDLVSLKDSVFVEPMMAHDKVILGQSTRIYVSQLTSRTVLTMITI